MNTFLRVLKSSKLLRFQDTDVYNFDLGANLLTFPWLKILRKEYQTIVREADVYLTNFTVTAQNALHQCMSGTASEWIAGHVKKKVVYFLQFSIWSHGDKRGPIQCLFRDTDMMYDYN